MILQFTRFPFIDCLYLFELMYLIIYVLTVSPGQPISIYDDTEVVTLVGSGQDTSTLINQKEIHWGVSLSDHSFFCCYFLFVMFMFIFYI